jgi:hypothetical protein
MKKLFLSALIIASFFSMSNAQVTMPAPSPTQTIKQGFAIGSIELTYSRPSAKGRKIYGDLVPYNKIWRTGANAATKLVLTEPLEIGGKKIDTGTYVLYAIPGIDTWEIVLNKGLSNWGIDGYKESEDVARFKTEPMKMKNSVETFTMNFANITPESCTLDIMWENTIVSVPIKADFRAKVRAQIEKAMATAEKKPYWAAAQFYNEYDKNLPKALEYAGKAIEANQKAYWIWLYKARIQKEMGDNAGAMASSQKSMELAKEDKNDDYVKLNQDLQKTLK